MIAAPPLELQELDQVALIAILLGLRQGEMLGLAWRDVDLDQRMLAVRETLQYRPADGFHLVPQKQQDHGGSFRSPLRWSKPWSCGVTLGQR